MEDKIQRVLKALDAPSPFISEELVRVIVSAEGTWESGTVDFVRILIASLKVEVEEAQATNDTSDWAEGEIFILEKVLKSLTAMAQDVRYAGVSIDPRGYV